METLLNIFTDWLTHFEGHHVLMCLAIFAVLIVTGVGVPIAEEVITIFAGVMVHRTGLPFFAAWLTCYVGIIVADAITMYLGWHFGRALLHRRWVKRLLHPRRVLWAHHQMQEHGAWMIVSSRFIPGMRYPVLLISGMMHLSRLKFLVADSLGALVTVTLQVALGYWFARLATVEELHAWEWPIALGLAVVGVIIITVYFAVRRRRDKRLGRTRRKRRSGLRFPFTRRARRRQDA